MKAGSRPQETAGARAALTEADAQNQSAQAQLKRTKRLLDEQVVSQRQWEEAKAAAQVAAGVYQETLQRVKKLKPPVAFDKLKPADAAAMMTDTTVDHDIVGAAAPQHMNKPMAEAAAANMALVGLPVWAPGEQSFARAVQKLVGGKEEGLATKLTGLKAPLEKPESGGSDDIGDISWTMPTITVRYPANIPNLPGHHWSNAIAMATPIAHRGIVAGAKVVAMTLVDLFSNPSLLKASKAYFTDVQTANQKYVPFLRTGDKPAIETNAAIMAQFRPAMAKLYYDPAKYPTYLDQLGVKWPPAP